MKKPALAIVASMAIWPAWAAGTINMINYDPWVGLDAPVFRSDGVTLLAGTNYVVQLMAGPTPNALAFVDPPATFFTDPTAFGYFFGPAVTVPTVVGRGIAYCEVVVWDTTLGGTTTGASAQQAYSYWRAGHADVWGASFYDYASGLETPFAVVTGDPDGIPPSPPGALAGLEPFSLAPIPEPNAVPLGLLAAGVWLCRALASRCRTTK